MDLHCFGPSVYCRVVRLVLSELALGYEWVEVDPFGGDGPAGPHPMGRVPVLEDDGFLLFETGAITRYLDRRAGGVLTPADPRAAARMDQAIGIVDAYAYWPLVRQVYAHGVFGPRAGATVDGGEVAAGLRAAGPVLDMLERIATEGLILSGGRSLADCHLAPMLSAFAEHPEGAAMLAERSTLAAWRAALDRWDAFAATAGAGG